jgi:hypothetical protein
VRGRGRRGGFDRVDVEVSGDSGGLIVN